MNILFKDNNSEFWNEKEIKKLLKKKRIKLKNILNMLRNIFN